MNQNDANDRAENEVKLHNLAPADAATSRRELLMASARASLLLVGSAGGLAFPSPASAGPAELFLNPFNKLSAHHRPVGMGARGRDAINRPDL